MEILILLFVLIWLLIAPIVLTIICIKQHNDIKKLRSELERASWNAWKAATEAHSCKPQSDAIQPQPEKTTQPPSYSDVFPSAVIPQADTQSNTEPEYHENTPNHNSAPAMPAKETPSPEQASQYNASSPAKSGTYDHSAYAKEEPSLPLPEKKDSTSTVNIILVLGAMFITLAGFVFAAAAWGTLAPFFKSAVLVSFSALFFLLHFVAEKKLELHSTGKMFFTLGSVFLPAAVAAAGILGVFGDYFSFSGGGSLLVAAVMTILAAVPFYVGTRIYSSRNFAKAFYVAVSCTVTFLALYAAPTDNIAAMVLSLYSLGLLLAQTKALKHMREVMAAEYRFFTVGSTWVLAALTLFMSDNDGLFVIPAAVFSAAFFIGGLRSKEHSAAISAFSVYLMAGMLMGVRPTELDGFVLAAALVMIVYTALSMMDIIPEDMRKMVGNAQKICAGAVIITGGAGSVFLSHGTSIAMLIAAVTVFVQLLVRFLSDGGRDNRVMSYFAYVWLAYQTMGLMNEHLSAEMTMLIMAAFVLALCIAEPFFTKRFSNADPDNKHFFTVGNTFAFALISLYMSLISLYMIDEKTYIPTVLFLSAAFFINALRAEKKQLCTAAFGIYLIIGTVVGMDCDSQGELFLAVSLLMLIFTAVSFISVIPEEMRKTANSVHMVTFGIVLFMLIIGLADSSDFEPKILIAALTLFAQSIITAYRRKDNYTAAIAFLSYAAAAFEGASFLYDRGTASEGAMLIFASLIFLYFLISEFTPAKKYISEISANVGVFIILGLCVIGGKEYYAYDIIIWAMLLAFAFIYGRRSQLGQIAAPVAAASVGIPCLDVLPDMTADLLIVTAVLTLTALAVLVIKPAKGFVKPFYAAEQILCAITVFMVMGDVEGEMIFSESFILIPLLLTVYNGIVLMLNRNAPTYKRHGIITLFMLCVTVFSVGLCKGIECELALLLTAMALILIFGVYIFPGVAEAKAGEICGSFLLWAIPAWGIILMLSLYDVVPLMGKGAVMTAAVLLTLCGSAVAVLRKNGLPMTAELAVFYGFVAVYFNEYVSDLERSPFAAVITSMTILAAAAAGRLIFKEKALDEKNIPRLDFLTFSGIAGAVGILILREEVYSDTVSTIMWVGCFTLAAVLISLFRKNNAPLLNRIALTGAAVMLFPVWDLQPFFELPEIIETEWMLLPVVMVTLAVRRIHSHRLSVVDGISYAGAVISLLILFFDAVKTGYPADAVMLGAVIMAVLAVSFMLRQKRWFVLAIVSAAAEAVLLTLMLWNSKMWWVYLLAAGTILIAIGMANEIKKRNASSQEKSPKFMSDWKW